MGAAVTIPRLGWSMEEGVFTGWMKRPGEHVNPGDVLFSLEGEKAEQEIEAIDGGILHLAPDAPTAGETVLVGRVIAQLCGPDEMPRWSAIPPGDRSLKDDLALENISAADMDVAATLSQQGLSRSSSVPADSPCGDAGNGDQIPPAASPSVRRLARQLGIDLGNVRPSLPGGRVTADDLESQSLARQIGSLPKTSRSSESKRGSPSTPRARRLARQLGVDITTLKGSGTDGRIRERDVVAAGNADAAGVGPQADEQGVAGTVQISRIRRTVARQMVRSRDETVPVTLTSWTNAAELLAFRAASKAADGSDAATLNDLLIKILAATILSHPLIAARWKETHLSLPGDRIDIGLAVDTPNGLVVPVVRDVAATGLEDISRQTRWLISRAHSNRLTAVDMQGAVFTLTSLGSFGVEFFTPVINYPEAAILGVGTIRRQPVFAAGEGLGFELQPQLPLSLTFDHRIIDGAPAAMFLQELKDRIAAVDMSTSQAGTVRSQQ